LNSTKLRLLNKRFDSLSIAITNEHDKDVIRKRRERSEAARIVIPEIVNIERRERALQDAELFLRTYFPSRYRLAFCADHKRMIEVMIDKAKHGGRQAIAAPRGRGKSELAKGMLVYLVLAGLIHFPLAVGATGKHALKIYKDFRAKLSGNDLLMEDFPEVCWPIRALDGAPQRASKQHVDGVPTRIVWSTNDYLSLPYVPGSLYGGVKLTYFGLDSAFRGVNIDGDRPDYVLIDDPETKESAKHIGQIESREDLIDQDIAGLASQEENLAIVLLTTIQNRYCVSYKVTDRKIRPAWNGLRFGMIVKWPDDMDLWHEYVATRHADQEAGDEHGTKAVAFYLANRERMDAGHEMLTEHYVPIQLADGTEVVHSALQQAWNKIADTNIGAYRTEYQNDPEPEESIESLNLTASKVQSRVGRTRQHEVAKGDAWVTLGVDIGKYHSHWTKIAWSEDIAGTIIDYGVLETHGMSLDSDNQAIERAVLSSLELFYDQCRETNDPLLCLIDSGTYTEGVYEACRRLGAPFFPSKGWATSKFKQQKRSNTKVPFERAYASFQAEENVWLYDIDSEYWKEWVHHRFNVQPFDEQGNRNAGSLVLFDHQGDKKKHLSFAHHIVSEERQLVPVFGKEMKSVWYVKSRNNHWLDSTALACAATTCIGLKLVPPETESQPKPKKVAPARPVLQTPYGQNFLVTQR
jgi:Phage terminase large subunit (GpA)